MILLQFPCICYSAVQHTLYHVSVCIVLQLILYMPIWWIPLSHQMVYILHLLSVCNIFVEWYLVCNVWSCAAIISLPVPPFRSPLNNHNNVSSPPISCLSTLVMYWQCSSLLSHFVLKTLPIFFYVLNTFFVSLLSVDWFNLHVTFAAVLIVYFIFVWLLPWLKQYLQTGLLYILVQIFCIFK